MSWPNPYLKAVADVNIDLRKKAITTPLASLTSTELAELHRSLNKNFVYLDGDLSPQPTGCVAQKPTLSSVIPVRGPTFDE